jgi:hypothetical protein
MRKRQDLDYQLFNFIEKNCIRGKGYAKIGWSVCPDLRLLTPKPPGITYFAAVMIRSHISYSTGWTTAGALRVHDGRDGLPEARMADNTCKDNPMKGIPLDINFTTFIYSLSSSAMVALGEAPDPTSGKVEFQRQMAKHTIDVLGMLKNKFESGLDDSEKKLLCDIVYNLRMAYVNRTK